MEIVLIQINDSKAHKLLADLEDLSMITVLEKKEEPNQKLSEKYLGSISSGVADELQKYVSQSRNEWNSNI